MTGYQIDLDPVHRVIRLTVTAEIMTLEMAQDIHTRLTQIASSGGPYAAIFDLSAVEDTTIRFVSDNLRRIFVQIYRIVGNVADAQDLTQEAFIKALQHQEQLKDELKAAHWLSRIATNTTIDFLRRNGRASFCEIDGAPPVDVVRGYGRCSPFVPMGRPHVVVGKEPVIFGLARVFQICREHVHGQFDVVHTLEEAYEIVKARPEDFTDRL